MKIFAIQKKKNWERKIEQTKPSWKSWLVVEEREPYRNTHRRTRKRKKEQKPSLV